MWLTAHVLTIMLGYAAFTLAMGLAHVNLGTGLHSYGFGSGGYTYIGAFVLFEVGVIVAALLRRRAEAQRHIATAAAAQPAH